MTEKQEKIYEIVKGKCPGAVASDHRGQLSIEITKESLLGVCIELKSNTETKFDMLTDITGIDWADKREIRFETVYFLYSMGNKDRVRLKVPVSEREAECPSVTGIWESADWYERETFDMYGIKFTGHPDMRRFYMPEDFNDPETGEPMYPLRKDFPMIGVPEAMPLPPFPEKYGELE